VSRRENNPEAFPYVQTFKLTESDLQPDGRLIEVAGELDLAVAERLQEAIDAAASKRQILIGLERCEFIDSTGIAVIVRAFNLLEENSRRLAVCCPSDQVLRVLTVTGLMDTGMVFASADEALGAASATDAT
jgi:anti-anti-sigma factor